MDKPLAEALRPKKIADFFGQQHLKNIIEKQTPQQAMIFYGPSGTGKTTLARLIGEQSNCHFIEHSAVLCGVKELKVVFDEAKHRQTKQEKTLLFIDEIHHFNRSQQDVLLPFIESGLIVFIGATTENPSFHLNQALLSRVSLYLFKPLDEKALTNILNKALKKQNSTLSLEISQCLVTMAMGDGRRLLNLLAQTNKLKNIKNKADLLKQLGEKTAFFDKRGDVFYQQLSAFHKSVRGSSPDGALYWMARMIDGGCETTVIARRLLAIASEDIGNADPNALRICLNAWDVYHRVGDKEGNRAVAQAAVYCAVCAKSNAVYQAFNQAMTLAKKTNHLAVPKHLCNAPTKLMKQLGYGENYRYAHNEVDALAKGQNYFPEALGEQTLYQPTTRGLEAKIKEKLARINARVKST